MASFEQDSDTVVALYNEGLSQKAIGEQVGVSAVTIGKWLKKIGVRKRSSADTMRVQRGDKTVAESQIYPDIVMDDEAREVKPMRDRTGWCIDEDHDGCPHVIRYQCMTPKCPAHEKNEVHDEARCPCACHGA